MRGEMACFLARLLKNQSGATAIEYGLIVAGVFLIALSAITAFGANASAILIRASNAIINAQ